MRVVGIDLGSRRIGVAVSDGDGVLASPYEVVERTGDRAGEHLRLARLVEEVGAGLVVVGLPLSLDGSDGPAALAAREEAVALAAAVGVPVETHDERFTTVSAHQAMAAAGTRSRARRETVDSVAAAVMLQSWLDRRRRRSGDEGASQHRRPA